MKKLLSALALAAVSLPRPAPACAPAPRAGAVVTVAREEAIIVWDATRGVEHFIRRADFETAEADFGFLVPTPAPPALSESLDDAFDRLDGVIRPPVQYVKSVRPAPTACLLLPWLLVRAPGGAEAPSVVRVLDTARVAGLDAVVLSADAPAALGDWLKAHGYAWRPALEAWVAPYVAAHWTVTAFKIARDARAPAGVIGSRSVRMTFATPAPFFPYREPGDTPARGGDFRVHLVAPARMAGRLGAAADSAAGAWAADTTWAGPLDRAVDVLAGALPAADVPPGAWLTSFLDRSATRAPGDLFFGPSADAAAVVPPPLLVDDVTEIPIPLDLVFGASMVTGVLVFRWRRRRARGR